MARLPVLYEDNHLLVVDKPSGLVTMGADGGETIYSLAARYLKEKYAKPGNVYVGIVSRLDRMTSGVLVLARTSKAASRLSQQFREGSPEKQYLAVVHGKVSPDEGEWRDWIYKDDAAHRMRCTSGKTATGKAAALRYRTLQGGRDRTLLQVELLTGRKHQIRAQFASAGHPVWGDRKYEAPSRLPSAIALHSYALTIAHPTRKEPMTFRAPLPASWNTLGFSEFLDRWSSRT